MFLYKIFNFSIQKLSGRIEGIKCIKCTFKILREGVTIFYDGNIEWEIAKIFAYLILITSILLRGFLNVFSMSFSVFSNCIKTAFGSDGGAICIGDI